MIITRLGSDREYDTEVDTIDVAIGGTIYRINEEFGELRVSCIEGKLSVMPAYANVVTITAI